MMATDDSAGQRQQSSSTRNFIGDLIGRYQPAAERAAGQGAISVTSRRFINRFHRGCRNSKEVERWMVHEAKAGERSRQSRPTSRTVFRLAPPCFASRRCGLHLRLRQSPRLSAPAAFPRFRVLFPGRNEREISQGDLADESRRWAGAHRSETSRRFAAAAFPILLADGTRLRTIFVSEAGSFERPSG